MTVPARREAARLLLSLDPPAWSVRHACAVADVAGWLAHAIARNGTAIDVRAVEAAALLHDVDKMPGGPRGRAPPRRRVRGLAGGARLGRARGAGAGPPRAPASPTTPTPPASPRRPSRPGSSPTPTSAPASAWSPWPRGSPRGGRRYPSGPGEPVLGTTDRPPSGRGWADETAALVVARADALEREICGLAGVEPHDVRRLRWSRRALRQASLQRAAEHEAAPSRLPDEHAHPRLLPRRRRLRAGPGGRGDRPPPRAGDGRRAGSLAGDRVRDERRPDRGARGNRPDVRRRLRGRGHGPWAAPPLEGLARGAGARAGRRRPGQRAGLRGAGRRRQQACGDATRRSRRPSSRPAARAASYAAPKAGQLAGWLRNLAAERGVALDRDASEELARRVGRLRRRGRRGPPAPGGARRRRSSRSWRSTARRHRSRSRTSGPWSRR